MLGDLHLANLDQFIRDRATRNGVRTKDNAIFAAKRVPDETNSVYLRKPSKLELSTIIASCSLNNVVVPHNDPKSIYCEK